MAIRKNPRKPRRLTALKKPCARTVPAGWRARHLRGTPPKILSDPEVMEFVDANILAMTFRELHLECLRRFGAARAPGKSALHRYWLRGAKPALEDAPPPTSAAEWVARHLPRTPPKILLDPELLQFADIALESMTFKEAAAECRSRFGARAPSKSALHRYLQQKRGRAGATRPDETQQRVTGDATMRQSTTAAKKAAKPQAINAQHTEVILQGLDARLARERSLIDRVAAAKQEYEAAHLEASSARGELEQARFTLRELKSRLEREGGIRASSLREKVAAAQARHDELGRAIADAEHRASELNAEIVRLQSTDIPACMADTSTEEVLAHQARVAEAAQKLRQIDELIAAQEAARDAISLVDLTRYETMLEKLHADRVLGAIDEAECQRQEAEISAQLEAAREANAQRKLDQKRIWHAIDGLQVRRREAEEDLAAVESKTQAVISHFLRSEMERLGAEYVPLALKVRDLFIRAVGLNGLAQSYPAAGPLLNGNWMDSFSLPSMRVDACQGKECPNSPGLLFSAEFGRYNSLWPSAVEAEKARLKSLGVKL